MSEVDVIYLGCIIILLHDIAVHESFCCYDNTIIIMSHTSRHVAYGNATDIQSSVIMSVLVDNNIMSHDDIIVSLCYSVSIDHSASQLHKSCLHMLILSGLHTQALKYP